MVEEDDSDSDNAEDVEAKLKKVRRVALHVDDEGCPIIPALDLNEAVTIDTVQALIRAFLNMHYRKYICAVPASLKLTFPQILPVGASMLPAPGRTS